jgi:hypothetical protein
MSPFLLRIEQTKIRPDKERTILQIPPICSEGTVSAVAVASSRRVLKIPLTQAKNAAAWKPPLPNSTDYLFHGLRDSLKRLLINEEKDPENRTW